MRTTRAFLTGALLLGAAACQDMDVTNPNNPNRESVLQSPAEPSFDLDTYKILTRYFKSRPRTVEIVQIPRGVRGEG